MVAAAFAKRLASAGIHPSTPPDRGAGPANLALTLPYYLAEAVELPDAASACRTMALANAFGAAHFLAQDGAMDGDVTLSPSVCRLSDVCLSVFTREYARLVGDRPAFWAHHDRYLDEYFTSLDRERSVTGVQEALAVAGRKLAPLKVTAATVCLLGRDASDARLPVMERAVEAYHVAYQLSDDLADLREDLELGRPSAAIRIMIAMAGAAETVPGSFQDLLAIGIRHGGLKRIASEMDQGYRTAAALAEECGALSLSERFGEMADTARGENARLLRRLRAVIGLPPEPGRVTLLQAARASRRLHRFGVHGDALVFDPGSGLFFEADTAAMDTIGWLAEGAEETARSVIEMNHGTTAIENAIGELATLEGAPEQGGSATLEGAPEQGGSATPGGTLEQDDPRTAEAVLEQDGPAPPGLVPEAGERVARFAPGPYGPRPGDAVTLSSLALNLSSECNLACAYCYLSGGSPVERSAGGRPPTAGHAGPSVREGERTMSVAVARRAIELMFRESFGERRVSVVLFGGEPLLAGERVAPIVEYARDQASRAGIQVRLNMTTNGTLLTGGVARELRALGVSVLVSIDGRKAEHDRYRHYPDGRGSYDDIVRNLSDIRGIMRFGARVTVTEESGSLEAIVKHLASLGAGIVHLSPESGRGMSHAFAERLGAEFEALALMERDRLLAGGEPLVGNFVEPMVSLVRGTERRLPCGAGTRYLCVATDGTLFFCHRFVGDRAYDVGHVATGIDRARLFRVRERLSAAMTDCHACWAFPLCGGPCYHDIGPGGESVGPESPRCALRRRCLEIAMWLYASLPAGVRERLGAMGKGEGRDDGVEQPLESAEEEGPRVQCARPCDGERRE